jgi:peptidoglycan/LPS O-acetylase OafA/YrhL
MDFRIQDHAPRLQAARGIAALCVSVGHCWITFVNGRIEEPTFRLSGSNAFLAAGELLFQQNTAVIFFYVLSGLVLGESLRRQPQFASFVVRRLCRLLPAMWCSIAFAVLAYALLPMAPLQGATRWLDALLGRSLSIGEVASDLAGLSWNANSVLWSVQIELAMIPIFPVLMAVSSRLSVAANLGVCAVLAALSLLLWSRLPPWANAGLYLYCFYAGIILPQLLQRRKARRILDSGVLAIAGLLTLLVLGYLYDSHRLWMPYEFVADAAISLQILAFIMCRPRNGAVSMLTARPLVWLGDVSYSFYVYSLSLQLLISGWVLGMLTAAPSNVLATVLTLVIALGTVLLALPLAAVSHRWIELPGIALGQRWSQRLPPVPLAAIAGRIVAALNIRPAVARIGSGRWISRAGGAS